MVIKIVLLLVGGAGCAVIGVLLSARLKTRATTLEALLHAFKAVEMQLSYTMKPAVEVMALVKEKERRCHGLFAGTEIGLERGLSFEQAWERALSSVRTLYCLEEEDVHVLARFGEGFGKTDLEGQKKLIRLTWDSVELLMKKAGAECEKKAGVYVRLGILAGIALVVFFL